MLLLMAVMAMNMEMDVMMMVMITLIPKGERSMQTSEESSVFEKYHFFVSEIRMLRMYIE